MEEEEIQSFKKININSIDSSQNINRTQSVDALESSTLTYHQKILLDDYLDKSFMMSVLCENTKNYYYKFGNVLVIPTILASSILCLLNFPETVKS